MTKLPLLLQVLQQLERQRAQLKPSRPHAQAGYTLIELLVVIIIIGVLATVAAPSWLGFIQQRRANVANEVVFRALQEAQSEAKHKKLSYSVSFRSQNGIPEVAVYQTQEADRTLIQPGNWKSLGNELSIKPGQLIIGTNLNGNSTSNPGSINYLTDGTGNGNNRITFDYLGALPPEADTNLTILIAAGKNGNPIESTIRCVKVETLLGSLTTNKGAANCGG